MSKIARKHLLRANQKLGPYIEKVPVLQLSVRNDIHPVNAISEVVIGQMLSRDAARSIRSRVYRLMEENNLEFLGALTVDQLRSSGLSGGKAKTVRSVFETYLEDSDRIDNWHKLDYLSLRDDVSTFWGISDWTASILALFYFGQENVFPHKDGSIKRAVDKLSEKNIIIDIEAASPYQSYLALYLWAILDNGFLD